MRILPYLALLCLPLSAAVTTVSQHVVNPDETDASGVVYIRISQACRSGSNYVGNTTKAVKFTGGNFSVQLVPNDTCLLATGATGTTYTVSWALSTGQAWTETWLVPTSASPVSVQSVIQAAPVTNIPTIIIPLTQLAPSGAASGQAIVWNGTQWAPGTVSGSGGSGGTWGTIIGNLADQIDLSAALSAKQPLITRGTTAQYFRGDLSLATFPTIPTITGTAVLKGSGGNAIAAGYSDVVALWATCSGFLKHDGTCATAANPSGYYLVTQSDQAPANSVNLGSLATGLLKLTVSAGVATPSIAVSGTDYLPANPTSIDVGTGTTAGYVDLFPPADAVHSVGFLAPATRSTSLRLTLPTADPSGSQALLCGTPSGGVSTCSWGTSGSMTWPGSAGLAVYSGSSSWGTSLSVVTTVGSPGSDANIPTEQAVRTAISTVSPAGTHGDLDFPAGATNTSNANIQSIWKQGANGLPPALYGGVSYFGILTATTDDYWRVDFRLPQTWTSSGVSVKMTVFDAGGFARTVTYTAQIGCTVDGSNVYNTVEPTYGTAATLSGSQIANSSLELTASLASIPAACTAGTMARLKIIRGSFANNHGIFDVALTW